VISNSLDFYIDFVSGQVKWHLIQEAIVISLTVGLLLYLYYDQKRKKRALMQIVTELKKNERSLKQSLEQSNNFIQNGRKEYSELIHQQFDQWQLSQSQQEIGLLLLKGLSFNEIAAIRETKEKTVRQQASEIYKKAGVAGRHAFSAWFFEDFL
jgi:DNA-binding NarL/FixJ family response regulator